MEKKSASKVAAKPFLKNQLSETTTINLKSLKSRLAKKDFKACQSLIHVLVAETPKKESRIVANLLGSIATLAEAKMLSEKKTDSDYANTIMKAYSAAGELYKNRNFLENATDMFVAADVLKARVRGL